MSAVSGHRSEDPFDHRALYYRDGHGYLEGTVPFIEAGLAAGDPVAVAVPGPNLDLLRTALGQAAEDVLMLDMAEVGANPGGLLPGVLHPFAGRHPDRRVRIVCESTWADRSDAAYPACARLEALINLAFTGRDAAVLCPYDTTELKEQVMADSRAAHPVLVEPSGVHPSDAYDPHRLLDASNRLLDPPPWTAVERAVDRDTIGDARQFTLTYGRHAGLDADRLIDLQIAITEMATHCVLCGGGTGTLRIWTERDQLVCQTEDPGHLADPLAGHRPFAEEDACGRDLVVINQVVDLLRLHTGPHGTTLRIYMQLL